MRERIPARLQSMLPPGCNIPAGFFKNQKSDESFGIYYISCRENRCLFIDRAFQRITGFTAPELVDNGLECLISLIHPHDLQKIHERVKELLQSLNKYCEQNVPSVLEFRIRRKDGSWAWIKEEKYILSAHDGVADRILCKITDITLTRQQSEIQFWQTSEHRKFLNRLFEMASQSNPFSHEQPVKKQFSDSSILTKREMEILKLISEGYSTKMIADQLYISIHTVETHRRHLLQKFNVRNSTAMIRQVFKTFITGKCIVQ